MITNDSPQPKIKHTMTAQYAKTLKRIVAAFAREIAEHPEDYVNGQSFVLGTDNLLIQRKKLAASIKEGMLERKDEELRIGAGAALVWFLRQEEARQDAILGVW